MGALPGVLHAVATAAAGEDEARRDEDPWTMPVPATATEVLAEVAPLPGHPARAATAAEAAATLREQEDRALVRLRMDLRHIVDVLLKVKGVSAGLAWGGRS
jgi:hypothetical protein